MEGWSMSKNINRTILRHFWHMSQYERKRLVAVLLFLPLNTFCFSTLVPLFIGKIIANLGKSGEAQHYIPLLITTTIIGVVANYIAFKSYMTFQARVMERLETEALDTLLKRSVGFHNNNIAGKLVSEASFYPTSYQILTNVLFITVLPIIVTLVTGIIVVFAHSVQLGILVVFMTVLIIAMSLWQTSRATEHRQVRHAARRKMIGHQADAITNSVTVKTFAQEASEVATSQRLSHKLANYRIRDWGQAAVDGSVRNAFMFSFEIAYVLLLIHLVQRDPTLLAIGIFTFSYVINLTNRMHEVGTIFRTIEDALLEAGDIMRILKAPPEIIDPIEATNLSIDHGAIHFNKVDFKYNDASNDEHVFRDLSLNIKPGEKVGLVGPSGGGKSTLSRLLLRFDDIQKGEITIDAQNIQEVTQESLRKNIAYVPQEPLLFHRSIFENISYGKPDASRKEVKEAARNAFALEFINALPEGFETIVGERGVKLSGGQRQRVAIARAMLKDAPILILDEATSALDSESEKLIQEALWTLMENRTAVVIAHRLSTIQKMDRILVLNNGAIVEEGSHKDLLKTNGLYAKLWSHQSGGFLEE
jgi:ATP-binding cassette subfamily B protein